MTQMTIPSQVNGLRHERICSSWICLKGSISWMSTQIMIPKNASREITGTGKPAVFLEKRPKISLEESHFGYIPGTQMAPCFDWKGHCFGGFNPQNRGQTGYRYIHKYTTCTLLPSFNNIFHPGISAGIAISCRIIFVVQNRRELVDAGCDLPRSTARSLWELFHRCLQWVYRILHVYRDGKTVSNGMFDVMIIRIRLILTVSLVAFFLRLFVTIITIPSYIIIPSP